jgi:hypothetical protein
MLEYWLKTYGAFILRSVSLVWITLFQSILQLPVVMSAITVFQGILQLPVLWLSKVTTYWEKAPRLTLANFKVCFTLCGRLAIVGLRLSGVCLATRLQSVTSQNLYVDLIVSWEYGKSGMAKSTAPSSCPSSALYASNGSARRRKLQRLHDSWASLSSTCKTMNMPKFSQCPFVCVRTCVRVCFVIRQLSYSNAQICDLNHLTRFILAFISSWNSNVSKSSKCAISNLMASHWDNDGGVWQHLSLPGISF